MRQRWSEQTMVGLALVGLTALAMLAEAEEPRDGLTEQERSRLDAKLERIAHPPDEPDGAARYYQMQRRPADGSEVDVQALYEEAREHMRGMRRYSTRRRAFLPSEREADAAGGPGERDRLESWQELGPGNIGGRTRALLIHPTNPAIMYAAGVSGGIWKTTSGGGRWNPIADNRSNIAFNSMVMDPTNPNVIYAGTGEGYFREVIRGTALPLRGQGIFKSTNGNSFRQLSSTRNQNFHWVNKIVVSHADPRRVYAATRTGVWRSVNSGDSWQRILSPGVNGGCLDLAIRSDRATDVLFASCGTFAQATVYRNGAAETAGGFTAVLTEAGMGRTSLAIAPSNQDVIYALAASHVPGPGGNFNGGLHAVFRSTQGGVSGSWQARVRNTDPVKLNTLLLSNPVIANLVECGFSGSNSFSNLGWYANLITVDPANSDIVWAGGVDLFRSNDGGTSWGMLSHWFASPPSAHADQHVIAFHPQYNGGSNQTFFLGNDGGVFRTNNARAAAATGAQASCNAANTAVRWTRLNNSYGVTQFYHGVPYPDGRTYFGGTQDNGTVRGGSGGVNGWGPILGGDGGYVAVDPGNTNILYAESQNLNISKSTDGGANFNAAVTGISEPPGGPLFITPFVMDPSNPRTLWTGGRFLWRTTDGANLWSRASAGLAGTGQLSAVAVDPSDSGHLLVGLSTGAVHRSSSALTTGPGSVWAQSTPRAGFVTWLAFDPQNSDVAYATYANFGGRHVWKTSDGGASWASIDGSGATGIPDIPVHAVLVDPGDSQVLYLGTDLGVFVSVDGGTTWAMENTGFANVVTESLATTEAADGSRDLWAFTHGRGAWRTEIGTGVPGTLQFTATDFSVNEDAGSATIRVSRAGGDSGTVSVSYATGGGTATPGVDFTPVSGTLTWAGGDTSEKTFEVPILDDTEVEGDKTVELTLTSPTGGAELGDPSAATLTIVDNDIAPGECIADDTTTCLADRFAVSVTWRDFVDETGPGHVVPGTPSEDSGLFYFFGPANWELLIKLVDGCGFNGHFWVFFAATTNVEYEVTVIDTERGQLKRYRNELGVSSPAVTDTEAFATCP